MKLKQLLEQLNQLVKERPEALDMSIYINAPDVTLSEVRGLKDLLYQLNQLAKERPEALEMEVWHAPNTYYPINSIAIDKPGNIDETDESGKDIVCLVGWTPFKQQTIRV